MNERVLADLSARCERLEAIRQLKARFLNACDRQDPEAVRDCFVEGEAIIDMPYFGRCRNRDEFVDDVFVPRGCHAHVLDMHHCSNGEIEFVVGEHARGVWGLDYRNINTEERTVTLMSAMYHDEYPKVDGQWKVSRSRTEYRTVMKCSCAPGTLEVQVAGRSLAPR